MAIFRICVRKRRGDGLWPVYLRITHNRAIAYLKTNLVACGSAVGKGGVVKDSYVVRRCMEMIEDYGNLLNRMDISAWSALQVKQFLERGSGAYSFTDLAERYIARLQEAGCANNAAIYRAAVKSLHNFCNSDKIGLEMMTRDLIVAWISHLTSRTKRARTLYPTCVRMIYREAMAASMEPDSLLKPIVYDPFASIDIPASEVPRKKAVAAEMLRKFFTMEIPAAVKGAGKAVFARDVAVISFCLGAINGVDLYNLRKTDLKDDVVCYCRSKTKGRRKDGAYMEMRVPDVAKPVIAKYLADDDDDRLFLFARMYSSARSFVTYVDSGLSVVSGMLGLHGRDQLSLYSFRHSWATVAKNDCGASLSEVGFALNHLQGDGVTRGYVKIDFTPAWELNAMVIDLIFSPAAKKRSRGSKARGVDVAADKLAGLSPDHMVYGRAYYRGEVLAEVSDIGFCSVDEVIGRLALRLPDSMPAGCAVQFRIKDLDADREAVYERIKGKGF